MPVHLSKVESHDVAAVNDRLHGRVSLWHVPRIAAHARRSACRAPASAREAADCDGIEHRQPVVPGEGGRRGSCFDIQMPGRNAGPTVAHTRCRGTRRVCRALPDSDSAMPLWRSAAEAVRRESVMIDRAVPHEPQLGGGSWPESPIDDRPGFAARDCASLLRGMGIPSSFFVGNRTQEGRSATSDVSCSALRPQ